MGHVSTRIRIYFVKPRIFLHDSPTRNPHLFESAFQSDLRLRPRESGKESGAPNENIVQNHLNMALLNVF